MRKRALRLLCLCAIGACAMGPPRGPVPDSALPEVPARDGALRLTVVYPLPDALLTAADSNFIFGATGSGRATLRINGHPVPVAANGAYLAFLPVPVDGVYVLEATLEGETARLERRVRLPETPPASDGVQIFDSSVYPTGAMALPAGEPIEIGFQGTPGGIATLRFADGSTLPLVESSAPAGADVAADFRVQGAAARAAPPSLTWYRGTLPARPLVAQDSAVPLPTIGMGSAAEGATLELGLGNDTVRLALPLNVSTLDPLMPIVGEAAPPAGAPPDWTVRGRASTAGPFHWFWPPGTRLHITGARGAFYRVQLATDLSAWVPSADVRLLPIGTPLPAAPIGAARFIAQETFVDLRIPLASGLPFAVDGDGRSLELNLYGATSETNFFQYGSLDPLIERAMWSQPADGVYRVSIELTEPVWGYHMFRDDGAFVLRIRRPPRIDEAYPLRGLRIAVDAGHPPAGATGPTGLTEAEANLAISLHFRDLLEEAGAHVIMPRTDASPVELGARPRMAADSNAHILLSIHNNAFPDGVNPFENHGTSAYFFQPHSLDLARHVQRALLAELGTRDIGIGRADLALVRPTWMPAVLSETLFMMIPGQEAALRDPAVQARIASAHVRALVAFLRERAAHQQ